MIPRGSSSIRLRGVLQFFFLAGLLPLSACAGAEPEATPTPIQLPFTTPDWFENAVVYEIFVRSYSDSDGDGIGDLRGITERLDYIESLRVDAIWLMPIYPSPSVHGYDVTDFFGVNPEYGDLEDLQELVQDAHARGIRILLDFVPSHLSDENPMFSEAYGNPEAENADWFVWTNKNNTQYAGFAGSRDMPRFNHYNPEVVDYLASAALFWLDLDGDGDYTDGVDGFRVDNATYPPTEFIISLRQAIKGANPEALFLGEAWLTNVEDLDRFSEGQFDALFDFPMYTLLQGNQDSNGDGILAGEGPPALINALVKEQTKRFAGEEYLVRFLSNHDTNRIATEVKGGEARERLAALFLASLPGPVMIYYGDEIGMAGQKGTAPFWDNYRREPMDWFAGEIGAGQAYWFKVDDRWNAPFDGISVEEQENNPDSLLNYYRSLLGLRKAHPAFIRGEFALADLEVSGIGPWGFVREAESEKLIVLFNFSDSNVEVTIQNFPFSSPQVIDLLTGTTYPASQKGQSYSLTVMPASGLILAADPDPP